MGRNIEYAKAEHEATINMKIDEIKADHIKIFDFLDMKYQLSHQTNLLDILKKIC